MVHLSQGELVFLLVLSFMWAVLGYRLSENDRRTLGRTPWGLPSAVWALFWFLSILLGLILYLFAHSAGVRRAQQNNSIGGAPTAGYPASVGMGQSMSRTPTAAEQFPAYPQPANVPIPEPGRPLPDRTVPAAMPAPISPPAWHPDPSGRFHFRWWDGSQWTSQVSTDGHHLIDTNPDQRIGPY